jgi:hypothetical protein
MNYLYKEFTGGPERIVKVILDGWANVLLLDDVNYNNYRLGLKFKYYGGKIEKSPYHIRPPFNGHWNVVVERAGIPGTISASINII